VANCAAEIFISHCCPLLASFASRFAFAFFTAIAALSRFIFRYTSSSFAIISHFLTSSHSFFKILASVHEIGKFTSYCSL
jgi:hypothetical protein